MEALIRGVLIKSPPGNSPQRIDFSCSGEFFFAKKLLSGAGTPAPMCSKVPITTGLGGRKLRNAPNVPRDFVCFRYVGRDFLEKTRGIVLSSTDDFINTPFFIGGFPRKPSA